jgi:hypothetical protein
MVDQPKPFESSAVLFWRAEKHFRDYHAWENDFRGKYIDTAIIDKDPKTGDILIKAPRIKNPPIVGSGIVFDVVNCLRSSLDHAVFDASVVLGGSPKPKRTKFPFGLTAEEAANDLPRKRAEVPECIRPHLLSYKPYKGGNPYKGGSADLLWGLNDLRNGKIHQTLRAMATSPVGALAGRVTAYVINGAEPGGGDDNVTVMRIAAGAEMEVKPKILAKITFGQGTAFAGEDTDDILEDALGMVRDILVGIEAETWRLDKIPPDQR